MATEAAAPQIAGDYGRLSAEDFETASIRSAAPSYISEAPSYHSTVPHNEPIPPYSPPERSVNTAAAPRHNSAPTLSAGTSDRPVTTGLPPIPPAPQRRASDMPSLGQFRIPTWSTISSNPTARHYHSVATRRATAAENSFEGLRRMVLERVVQEEEEDEQRRRNSGNNRVRPLEDPYLVGEVAARRAREERLARENGDEVLIREDKRWDWFLAQMKDWDDRQASWNAFRRQMERPSRGGRLARRIGARLGAM